MNQMVANLSSPSESVLVVEADDLSRQSLLDLLRAAGYRVSATSSQDEGFQRVQETGVDLLLLSANLSDVQCCNALSEIKGNAAVSGTRVILLTRGGGLERARAHDAQKLEDEHQLEHLRESGSPSSVQSASITFRIESHQSSDSLLDDVLRKLFT